MTVRGFLTLMVGATLILIGLSTGNSACMLTGGIAASALSLMFLSILISALSLRVTQQISPQEVLRQNTCQLNTRFFMLSLLPLAPLVMDVQLPSGRHSAYLIHPRPFGHTDATNEFVCPHVGEFSVGIQTITLHDSLGMFRFSRHVKGQEKIRILPQAASVSPVPIKPGSEEGPASAYATTDYTTPDSIRGWVEGDELKRVHWKLSASRRTLLVRTYEQQNRPDTLILLNTGGIDPENLRSAFVIDALTESCAGTVSHLLSENRPVCIPITRTGGEIRGESMRAFDSIQRMLAQLEFTAQDLFPETLELAAPRLQRSGTLLIFSPVITPHITEAVIRLSLFGTGIRFTLACREEIPKNEMKLLQMLVAANIETFQVSIS